MKRDIYLNLLSWKNSPIRKPLVLKGARQTGKTYILKEFGKSEYSNIHYFNFEENPDISSIFDLNLDPERIIQDLSIFINAKIQPHTDLIIFDEIQSSPKALNSLKYFQEDANDYHIVTAGSLLGIKLSSDNSFPVGKVNFLDLYPLSFLEYLDAIGKSRYRKLLEDIETITPLPEIFHKELIAHLRKYYLIGGMPEALKCFIKTQDLNMVRQIQSEIIHSYMLDFAKHAPSTDIPRLSLVWKSICKFLSKENKKFIFSAIKKGARAREYESALSWLEDAGLIYRSSALQTIAHPLKNQMDQSCFKIFFLDVGILCAMAEIKPDIILKEDRLFNDYKGAFAENYVAQQLKISQQNLMYWRNRSGQAEIDFIYEMNEYIFPLEVKSGINTKSKSLKSYADKFDPSHLLRTTLLNLKNDNKTINIPLYAINVTKLILRTLELKSHR